VQKQDFLLWALAGSLFFAGLVNLGGCAAPPELAKDIDGITIVTGIGRSEATKFFLRELTRTPVQTSER